MGGTKGQRGDYDAIHLSGYTKDGLSCSFPQTQSQMALVAILTMSRMISNGGFKIFHRLRATAFSYDRERGNSWSFVFRRGPIIREQE